MSTAGLPTRMRAVILGLGRISWRLDQGLPDANGGALTHLSSLRSRNIQVLAGMDPDTQARAAFEKVTGLATVATVPQALALQPDIVCIASPNAYHGAHLAQALDASIPYIWLEKPATVSYAQTQALALRAEGTASRILVGFQRRYLPIYERLRETDLLGPIEALQVVYSRGLETNGIHMLDLVSALSDDAPVHVLGVSQNPTCRHSQEPSPSFLLQSQAGLTISVTGLDLDHHSIDITTHHTRGRQSVLYGGATYRQERTAPNPLFPGFFRLFPDRAEGPSQTILDQQTRHVFPMMLEDLISGAAPQPRSNLTSAANGQRIMEAVLEQCRP